MKTLPHINDLKYEHYQNLSSSELYFSLSEKDVTNKQWRKEYTEAIIDIYVYTD